MSSTLGIAFGLIVGCAVIITTVILWGQRTEEDLGPSSQPEIYVCAGDRATIVGTDGDDVLRGTDRDDVIHARRGNDVVRAGGGDDIVCGGAGDDELRGGGGVDDIRGEDGTDTCIGGAGEGDRFETCESEEQ